MFFSELFSGTRDNFEELHKFRTWYGRTAKEGSVPIALGLDNECVSSDVLDAFNISRVDSVVLRDVWIACAVVLELDA